MVTFDLRENRFLRQIKTGYVRHFKKKETLKKKAS